MESQGTCFPADFRGYLSYFGTGWLGDFFVIWNPFSKIEYMNWQQQSQETLRAFKEIQREFPEFFGHWIFYPEPGGLLPCGRTENGDTLFWVTKNQPDRWTIAVGREEPLDFYTGSLCEFLYHLLNNFPTGANLPDLREVPKVFSRRGRYERFK